MELEKCKDCETKNLYGKEIVCTICKDNERRLQLIEEYDNDLNKLKEDGWLL